MSESFSPIDRLQISLAKRLCRALFQCSPFYGCRAIKAIDQVVIYREAGDFLDKPLNCANSCLGLTFQELLVFGLLLGSLLSASVESLKMLGNVDTDARPHDALHLHLPSLAFRTRVTLILIDAFHSCLQLVQKVRLLKLVDIEGKVNFFLLLIVFERYRMALYSN